MSFNKSCRKLLLLAGLGLGLIAGSPMRPDEIEELMAQLNQPKIAHVLRQEKEDESPNDSNPTAAFTGLDETV